SAASHRAPRSSSWAASRSADRSRCERTGASTRSAISSRAPCAWSPGSNLPAVPLATDFQAVLDSLPPDWTQLELDLRIADEHRYIDAATLLVQINAMPYSEHDWHWRLRSARTFGHAAAS